MRIEVNVQTGDIAEYEDDFPVSDPVETPVDTSDPEDEPA